MDTLGGFDADDSNWFRWKSGRDKILLGFIMGFWHAWNSMGHVKIPQLGSITSNQLRAIENILGNASQVVRPISANMTMTTKVLFIWGCTLIPPKFPTYSPPISLFLIFDLRLTAVIPQPSRMWFPSVPGAVTVWCLDAFWHKLYI